MRSPRQSRSRILFEIFCALAVSASCVGAWMQTGASALLPAAAVVALYAFVHAFDLAGRESAVAVNPQLIDFAADQSSDLLIDHDAVVPLAADTPKPTIDKAIEDAKPGEPVTPEPRASRGAKAPRKGGGRRASAPRKASDTERAPSEETEIASIHPEPADADPPVAYEEVAHPHIEALFEPEPFVRLPRPAFGRKAG